MVHMQLLSGSAEQPAIRGVARGAAPAAKVPIIEVAYPYGKWWSLDARLSQIFYESHERGQDVEFTWHWGKKRTGSFAPHGKATPYSNYQISFQHMLQVNKDNNRPRSVRIAWVEADEVNDCASGAAQAARNFPEFTTAGKVPIIEVAYGNGMWWSFDDESSQRLYEFHERGLNAEFTWNWEDHRIGCYAPNGEASTKYLIDFEQMQQLNTASQHRRSVRIVWVEPDQVNALYFGQLAS